MLKNTFYPYKKKNLENLELPYFLPPETFFVNYFKLYYYELLVHVSLHSSKHIFMA